MPDVSGLADLSRQVAALRGRPVAEAAAVVADLVDDLANVAADERVEADTATGLITRALRAIRPRAARPADRHAALAALRQAVAEGPRPPHRPAVGSPRTVRVDDGVWATVGDYAARRGLSESAAAAELLDAATRCGFPGCVARMAVVAGGMGFCSREHVPAELRPTLDHAANPLEAIARLNDRNPGMYA